MLRRLKIAQPHREYAFIREVRKDLDGGFTPIVCIVGRPRTGKSMAGLEICKMFDKTFTIQSHCFFNMRDFLNTCETARGRWLMIDEADERMNKLEHWSAENKVMNTILRTQAINKNCLVFCLPAVRNLASMQIPFVRFVIKMKARGIGMVKRWDYNWDTLDAKPLKSRIINFNMRIPRVPKEMVAAYRDKELRDKAEIFKKRKLEFEEYEDAANPDVTKFIKAVAA